MSVLDNVVESVRGMFDRSDDPENTLTISECAHEALAPRWDDINAMGREDLIASYQCATCGAVLERERAEEIQRERIERLRQAG